VIENGKVYSSLCTQCGVCAAICPPDAIRMVRSREGNYYPEVDQALCTLCGLCNDVCPVYPFNDNHLLPLFSENGVQNGLSFQPLLGYFRGVFVGYARDAEIRRKGASGGAVTALLLHALRQGLIDAAVVVRMKKGNPLEAEAIIASTEDDLRAAQASKYISVTLFPALRQVLKERKYKRVAVVGVPCMVAAVQRWRLKSRRVFRKVAYTFALQCKQTKDQRFVMYILKRLGVEPGEVEELSFRGNGWPGNVRVRKRNGQVVQRSFRDRGLGSSPWRTFCYAPLGCLVCGDVMGEWADLSFGDPWIPEYMSDTQGHSLILCRSQAGMELVEHAVKSKEVVAEPFPATRVVEAHRDWAVAFKKENRSARIYWFRKFFDPGLPAIERKSKLTWRHKADALWFLGIRSIFSSSVATSILSKSPDMVHRMLSRIPLFIFFNKFRGA